MLTKEITKLLNQFKRVHKRQIEPHSGLLSAHISEKMKRKTLASLTHIQLYSLLLQLIMEIDDFQNKREKPHQGVSRFRTEIINHIRSSREYIYSDKPNH